MNKLVKESLHESTNTPLVNERLNLKNIVLGTALAGAVATGGYNLAKYINISPDAELSDVQPVGGLNFNQYNLSSAGESFDLNIKDGIIVSHHTYKTGSGDNEVTHYRTNLIIPNDSITEIWYKSTFASAYASLTSFSGAKKLKISDLKKQDETNTYVIYTSPKWIFPFDYIIINKGHKEGEEFKISDSKISATYLCDKINRDIYIFSIKGLAGGKFGGAGSGGDF